MKPLWTPSPERAAATELARFMKRAGKSSYEELHRWSVRSSPEFWNLVWDFCEVKGEKGKRTLVDGERMPGAKWFPDARLNYAENLLKDQGEAIVFWGEERIKRRMTHEQLHRLVSRLAQALADAGVKEGDRVAGYLPNVPEATAALLATASLGAVWSSCSPDFGVQGVLDRFGQIEPKVLLCADGYLYGGKEFDSQEKAAQVAERLPSVEEVVVVDYLGAPVTAGTSLYEFLDPFDAAPIRFEPVEFNHPLYILYSSGTTGVPKCIVHGTGGTLLQHFKEHRLHTDVRSGDRLFYFTTLGWMMWNWLVSGLASGATLLLYDGSPFVGRGKVLFDFAEAEGMTHFGTSAKFIDALAKAGLKPRETHRLDKLRTVLSTGSPLAPEGFDYIYKEVKSDVCLSSISGGTDIVSCFVLGNPVGPVWRGEIQAKGLGMAVEVFDDAGKAVKNQKGELVCTQPFPSMPIGFWNDPDGARYRAAYFEKYPNVWRHGDWSEETEHGGVVIYGRSDAVLNPGGVRIGTAEIYRQVEKLEEVVESLVIGQDWEGDVRVVLFVKLKEGVSLDDALIAHIKRKIRDNTTPRHVPAKIVPVADIPRTKSGKIVELAVREVVHGRPVKNQEALANPEALEHFRDRPELRAP
ncbi:MAG: acetoacetyl-CoA synthase [Burkholderiales bacterium]|jgi:acetoacetyl-CoA synthetase|nr:acetoacetyl-CoA synthase [Burkholderiales bacterium]